MNFAKYCKSTEIPEYIWRAAGLPAPIPEYRFHATRRWRIDYAWPNVKLAVEIEGGVWTQGRHTRGAGAIGDMEKYNELSMLGWTLLRYTPKSINYDQILIVWKVLNSARG